MPEIYDLISEIARGGEGVVFLARRRSDGTDVAIKQPLGSDPWARSQIQQEYVRRMQVRGHRSVEILDANLDAAIPFIVYRYVKGGTLQALLESNRKAQQVFHPIAAIKGALQIFEALQDVHVSNVIHRDVKPSNILVDDDGSLRLHDFGVGRTLCRATGEHTRRFVGTEAYAAPEQIRGEAVDQSIDFFSVGRYAQKLWIGEYEKGDVPFRLS